MKPERAGRWIILLIVTLVAVHVLSPSSSFPLYEDWTRGDWARLCFMVGGFLFSVYFLYRFLMDAIP